MKLVAAFHKTLEAPALSLVSSTTSAPDSVAPHQPVPSARQLMVLR
ncbi:MAG TPA: hypothetical protein VKB88_10710 [Bryobacteraceae bacterium]|nr:hypothetical protein [Bryobacteraceae bacterium]